MILTLKERYESAKGKLLNTPGICKENKEWYKQILEFFERKLKRINNLSSLDDGCYKTLLLNIDCCKRTEKYFNGKPGIDFTEEDITRVYDGLEDGIIKPNGDRKKYFKAFMKGKPFEFIGKREIAKRIIQYTNKQDEDVRFFSPETYNNIFNELISLEHKTSIQLAWDITENMTAILKLKKKNCKRKINEDGNPEYHIILPKDILKRTRTARTEITFFPETTQLLDRLFSRGILVKNEYEKNKNGVPILSKSKPIYRVYEDDDYLFSFEQRQAQKFFKRACIKANAKLEDKNIIPYIKDIRSSSACNFLELGLTTDEIKSRLGHKPSSNVLDKYVSYKAMNKEKPRKRVFDSSLLELQRKLKNSEEKIEIQKREMEKITSMLYRNTNYLSQVIKSISPEEKSKKKEFFIFEEDLKNINS